MLAHTAAYVIVEDFLQMGKEQKQMPVRGKERNAQLDWAKNKQLIKRVNFG